MQQPLLNKSGGNGYRENCSGCRIDFSKETNPGIPYKHLFYVGIIALCAALPISSLFPFLYFMIRDFHIAKTEEDIGYYAGLVALTSFVWGVIADRHGRKPVIIFGMFALIVLNTLFGLSTSFWMAVSTRFLLGSLYGILGPIRAYASEVCRQEHQALGISIISTEWGVGLVTGPALGGFLAQPSNKYPSMFPEDSLLGRFPYFLPCLVISVLSLGVFVVCFSLPETLHNHKHISEECGEQSAEVEAAIDDGNANTRAQKNEEKGSTSEQSLWKNWPLMSSIIVFYVFQLHDIAYSKIFSLWAVSPKKYGGLGYSTADVGEALSISGFGLLLFQLFFYLLVERKLGTVLTVLPLLPYVTTVMVSRIGAGVTVPLLAAHPFLALLKGLSLTLLVDFASLLKNLLSVSTITGLCLLQNSAVEQKQRGAANGISMAAMSLSKVVGPAVGGSLFSWAQKRQDAPFLPGNQMVFFMLNVVNVIGLLMTFEPFLVTG